MTRDHFHRDFPAENQVFFQRDAGSPLRQQEQVFFTTLGHFPAENQVFFLTRSRDKQSS